MRNAIKLRIDGAGRIVIPKPLRERLGLRPGVRLEAHEEAQGLVLKAPSVRPALIREKGLWVHQGEPSGPLDLKRIIEEVREVRHRAILES